MFIDPSTFSHVTRDILGAAIQVHKTLGPGLLESIYLQCLQFELASHTLRFAVQRPIPIVYKGNPLDASYRIDLIVEDLVVVEVKSVAALAPVHKAQVLTYLRLTGCPAGLLIHRRPRATVIRLRLNQSLGRLQMGSLESEPP